MFSRKSGLVPGFTTILKCTPECDGIVALHTDGKVLQEEICFALISGDRMMKCDVPTPRETLHPQHLQAQEFRRQLGQTHGLQATMHIWQSCKQQPAQLQNLLRLLSATSMMQHKCGPSVRRRPDGSFMLGTSALCSECQMISFMA